MPSIIIRACHLYMAGKQHVETDRRHYPRSLSALGAVKLLAGTKHTCRQRPVDKPYSCDTVFLCAIHQVCKSKRVDYKMCQNISDRRRGGRPLGTFLKTHLEDKLYLIQHPHLPRSLQASSQTSTKSTHCISEFHVSSLLDVHTNASIAVPCFMLKL
jgi:hypothetical protein